MLRHLREPGESRRGQSLVEYALILALILIVVLVALTNLGQTLPGTYNAMAEELDGS